MRKLAGLAAASLAVVLSANVPAMAQKQGGTLRIYHRDNPPSASIHEEATISTVMPFMGLFNNLVLFDQHKKSNSMDTIVPDLAESWAWDESKTKLTFKLRQGVKWHDGKPFTAKDVKCTWDMLQGKDRDTFRKNPRAIWYHNLKEVTVNGDSEATFVLKRPQAAVPDAARLRLFAGLSLPRLAARHAHQADRHRPLQVRRVQGQRVDQGRPQSRLLEEGPAVPRRRRVAIIASRSTRILAFVAGEFDMTFNNDVTIPLLKDVKSQAPKAVCEINTAIRQPQPDREPRDGAVRQSADPQGDGAGDRPQGLHRILTEDRATRAAPCCRRRRACGACRRKISRS